MIQLLLSSVAKANIGVGRKARSLPQVEESAMAAVVIFQILMPMAAEK